MQASELGLTIDMCQVADRAHGGLRVLTAVQANELELAIDVYKSLLSEGCTPNLVTFNTLIEVYSKTGAWQDAVSVLDALEAQVRFIQGVGPVDLTWSPSTR